MTGRPPRSRTCSEVSSVTILEEITAYAHDCIDGKWSSRSCQKHKWACMRLLRDIERMGTEGFPYVWNEDRAQSIVDWFKYLRHSKGILAGQPIYLTTWQKFCICQIYGWVRMDTRTRRFRKSYKQVARKNAKSQEQGGVGLYEMSVTATKNHEVAETYTAGTKRDQSKVVFREADLMLRGSPLRTKFKVRRDSIEHLATGSTMKPLSKDDRKEGDGSNPALLTLDEYHQHPTAEFYDLGLGSQTIEPLLNIITTAGVDLNYPCYVQEYQYCSRILDPDSDVEDDAYFVDICELDPEDYENLDNLDNEELWWKANPIRMSYPEGRQKIREEWMIAKEVPEKMSIFLTKMMDVWVQARQNGYMNMSKWKACEVEELPIDIKGQPVYIGLDLSAKLDMTSVSFVIPFTREDDDRGNPVLEYIVFCHSFIPSRERLIEHIRVDKVAYDAWERQGFITVTDTPIVDQSRMLNYIFEFVKSHELKIQCFCFDPANAAKIMMDLAAEGFVVEEVFQSYKHLNEATCGFREQVYSRHVYYLHNPMLNYAMGNAVLRMNNGLIKVDKDATTKRIDPVDATLCGFKLASYHDFGTDFEEAIEAFLNMEL